MAEPTATCSECGVSILEGTAAKTGGKCLPCSLGTRAQIEQGKRWAAEQREWERKKQEALQRIRRKEQPTFADFLPEDDPIGVLWTFLVGLVFRGGAGREHLEALSRAAKVIYLANTLDGEVFNGGFHQYLANSSGKYAHETLFVLHELAAPRRAGLLQRAIHMFPDKRVPDDRAERNDALDKVDPEIEIFEALDDEYYSLEKAGGEDLGEQMLSFMRQHAAARIAA